MNPSTSDRNETELREVQPLEVQYARRPAWRMRKLWLTVLILNAAALLFVSIQLLASLDIPINPMDLKDRQAVWNPLVEPDVRFAVAIEGAYRRQVWAAYWGAYALCTWSAWLGFRGRPWRGWSVVAVTCGLALVLADVAADIIMIARSPYVFAVPAGIGGWDYGFSIDMVLVVALDCAPVLALVIAAARSWRVRAQTDSMPRAGRVI